MTDLTAVSTADLARELRDRQMLVMTGTLMPQSQYDSLQPFERIAIVKERTSQFMTSPQANELFSERTTEDGVEFWFAFVRPDAHVFD